MHTDRGDGRPVLVVLDFLRKCRSSSGSVAVEPVATRWRLRTGREALRGAGLLAGPATATPFGTGNRSPRPPEDAHSTAHPAAARGQAAAGSMTEFLLVPSSPVLPQPKLQRERAPVRQLQVGTTGEGALLH